MKIEIQATEWKFNYVKEKKDRKTVKCIETLLSETCWYMSSDLYMNVVERRTASTGKKLLLWKMVKYERKNSIRKIIYGNLDTNG